MTSTTSAPQIVREIGDVVGRYRPSSLVYACKRAVPALDRLGEAEIEVRRIGGLHELERAPRFELGIVLDYLEHCSHEQGVELLGRLRNVHCQRIWVAVQTGHGWDLNAMIGLGFKRSQGFAQAREPGANNLCTYVYDIENYNHKREWNTPKYWANPENWGKYWW